MLFTRLARYRSGKVHPPASQEGPGTNGTPEYKPGESTTTQSIDRGSDKGPVMRKDDLAESSNPTIAYSPSIPDSMHTISAHHSDAGSDKGSLDERLDRDWLIDPSLMAHIVQEAGSDADTTPPYEQSAIPAPTPDETTLHSHKNDDSKGPIVCDVCSEGSPKLCCITCDPKGLPYHEECWVKERLHRPRPDKSYQTHQSIPITWLPRLNYLKEPNKQTSIEKSKLQEDDQNCFIELDIRSLDIRSRNKQSRFKFGHRAFPLLRHEQSKRIVQYPSFVSFVGCTMNGKSFLIRALQYTEETHGLPTPIPAPGAKLHNHSSTSSDIHLYPDSTTASDESPILFLDCEGFEGSDIPVSLVARLTPQAATARREFVEAAYPRLVYAFSTCIVFVTSGPLAGADDIKRRLISYASKGASGSKNQGFKPSLFVVFNRFRDGNKPGFDWSIDSSSKAFLADKNRAELENFYSNIRVVYIPSMDREAAIALQQIDAFEQVLREEHKIAFLRRREFRLDFTCAQLTLHLRRALNHFSVSHDSPFDWSSEAPPSGFSSEASDAMLIDLWTQYIRYHATPNSAKMPYDLVRSDFEKHVALCLRLELKRHPQPGLHYTYIPPSWAEKIRHLFHAYAPCGASLHQSHSVLKCEKVRLRHGDHHQSLYVQGLLPVARWQGDFESCRDAISQTFEESFAAVLRKSTMDDVSLHNLRTLPKEIRSVVTCVGCLQGPPSTILGCGHAFCVDCIQELTHDDPLPHQLKLIECPIHQKPQQFSPRLLPIQSGYRILSLDGGGVKGVAQLIMLTHIEEKCFGIPSMYLFDLVVGTSIGGQIALALTSATNSEPLTGAAATEKFRALIKNAFGRNSLNIPGLGLLMGRTKYKTATLETCLQALLGKETKLFSATPHSQTSIPNIAVTTVVLQPYKAHLMTNYNRKPLAPDALPLFFGPTADDCIPVWAAARGTSAAVPYFKPLEWQGQMFLDGGFKLNCPSACAYSEAKCIWPDKRCDVLLSLGTGRAMNRQQPPVKKNLFRLAYAVADDMTNAEEAWTKFKMELPRKDGIFRLTPAYSGSGFALDECQKLNEIERQAEAWIATQNSPLTHICHQLIAALFFFRLLGPAEGGMQVGEIVCRLPVGLEVRQKLIDHMLLKGSKLFVVEFEGCPPETRLIVNAPPALRRLDATDELCLRVEPLNLSATGATKIHIRMQSLDMHQLGDAEKWLPISGSPYPIQEF